MADEQDFPTAIVPARAGTVAQRFDKLARAFGDPMARLFALSNHDDPDMQFKAAAELMPYRYPKLKVSDVNHHGERGGGVNIQINIGGEAPAVDVTPPSVDPLS